MRAAFGLLLALLLLVTGACSAAPPEPPPAPGRSGPASTDAPVAAGRLRASLTQDRFAEGTRSVLAGVTNASRRTLRITDAEVDWPGLGFPPVHLEEPTIEPGETAAFTVAYDETRCDGPVREAPRMRVRVDGRAMTLPLHVDIPGLLGRLRDDACAQQRLSAIASVHLRLAERTSVVHGTEQLPADLVVQRRGGSTAPVTVTDLAGSVLISLTPRAGRGALPVSLRPGRDRLVLPVLLASTGRCDGHARSQSSQTFLLGIYVRRGSGPVQRVVQIPARPEQERLLAMLDRVCR
jgi:hypothetical protein